MTALVVSPPPGAAMPPAVARITGLAHRGLGARRRAGPRVGAPPDRGRPGRAAARPRDRSLRPFRRAVPPVAARAPRGGAVPARPRLHPRHRLPPAPGAAPPDAARAGRLLRGGGVAPQALRGARGGHRRRAGTTSSRSWPSARASSTSRSSASGWRGRSAGPRAGFPCRVSAASSCPTAPESTGCCARAAPSSTSGRPPRCATA